jgi:hypothetical protein
MSKLGFVFFSRLSESRYISGGEVQSFFKTNEEEREPK